MSEQKENAVCPACGEKPILEEADPQDVFTCLNFDCMLYRRPVEASKWNAPRPAATAIKIEAFKEAQNACSQFLESDATHNEKHIAVNIAIRGCQQAIEQLKKG